MPPPERRRVWCGWFSPSNPAHAPAHTPLPDHHHPKPTVSAAPSSALSAAGASNQPPAVQKTPAAVLYGQVSAPNLPMAPPRRAPAARVLFLARQAVPAYVSPSPAVATVEQEKPANVTIDRARAAVLAWALSADELALCVARLERNQSMEQALRQAAATGLGLHIPTADQFAATVAGHAATSDYDERVYPLPPRPPMQSMPVPHPSMALTTPMSAIAPSAPPPLAHHSCAPRVHVPETPIPAALAPLFPVGREQMAAAIAATRGLSKTEIRRQHALLSAYARQVEQGGAMMMFDDYVHSNGGNDVSELFDELMEAELADDRGDLFGNVP
ncbi:hypothetical protein BCR44DRAFT_44173 [Catenaria anguillulae PL171]|uniref:Uncharacterized protein n=1 Tax=Catenaria anguillulae PL171 TaxID=765915 RepID=A0A1Y2H575_9FUNG|nr:hypothetical protein BCR44DRAFT_44173 [Catenaria anguillulae PL171]